MSEKGARALNRVVMTGGRKGPSVCARTGSASPWTGGNQRPMDAQVALFADLTGCEPEQAHLFLQNADGNLELAVNEFFLSQEEGAGPMVEGSDGEDEGEDGYDDDDTEMNMPPLIPVSPSAPAGVPPPSKRPKVEMRQARWLPCSLTTPLHDRMCLAGAEPPRRIGGAAGAAAACLWPRQAQRRRRFQLVESAAGARHRSPPRPPGSGNAGWRSAF